MEQAAKRASGRRVLWTALVIAAPIALLGCEERPAYVIDPDRSQAVYPVERHSYTVTVREGDSLSRIAERCDTDSETVARMNDLDDYRAIYPGQVLRVPSPPRAEDATFEAPRPIPRPHYVEQARYDETPRPHRRPDNSDNPPPPPPPVKQTADNGDSQQSWWSYWWPKAGDDTNADTNAGTGADAGTRFSWPVQGRVIEGFGRDNHGERNDGINIAAQEGAPIRAAAGGTVTYTGNELKGYGNLVLIKHPNGFVTAYAHAGSIRVSRGDVVHRGDIIGTAGATGDVDRPQLHFEIRKGVQAVDPERYLGRAS